MSAVLDARRGDWDMGFRMKTYHWRPVRASHFVTARKAPPWFRFFMLVSIEISCDCPAEFSLCMRAPLRGLEIVQIVTYSDTYYVVI